MSAELIEEFKVYHVVKKGRAKRTAVEYGHDIARLEEFAGKDAVDVTFEEIDAFLFECAKRTKPVSVRRKIASIKCYIHWLMKTKKRGPEDPTIEIDIPKSGKRFPHVLSKADVAMLLDCYVAGKSDHDRARDDAMMHILYAAGLRRQELVDMDIEHLDFANRCFRVIGKGDKERECFMDAKCEEAIRKLLSVHPTGSGALFVGNRGVRLGVRQMWALFKERARMSGMPKESVKIAHPHTMRHSFATHLIENGCDLITIKELLGHENVQTTQLYTNISASHKRSAYEKFHT